MHVFDNFGGKHPKEIRGGIEALRKHYPGARVMAVFEPYGPYLARWARRYALALGGADKVVVAPAVYLGLTTRAGASVRRAVERHLPGPYGP